MTQTPPSDFAALIRDVRDFPKPGILFKDITPLLADPAGFAWVVETLAAPWRMAGVGCVAGVEARGFILGAALATELGAGFVPVRKPGKLPARVIAQDYALEYGSDRLEVHESADNVPSLQGEGRNGGFSLRGMSPRTAAVLGVGALAGLSLLARSGKGLDLTRPLRESRWAKGRQPGQQLGW